MCVPAGHGSPRRAGAATEQWMQKMSVQFEQVARHVSSRVEEIEGLLIQLEQTAAQTACWMLRHDARAPEIDQSQADLRARMDC